MPVSYELQLDDQKGNNIATLGLFKSLTWVRSVNNVGSFSVQLARDSFDNALFAKDNHLQIQRKAQGVPDQLIMVCFLRYRRRRSLDSLRTVALAGPDGNYLITKGTVNETAGSAGSTKGGPADDVMKAYVREAIANLAAADRDITAENFSVQADLGLAPVVDKAASRRNLLPILQEIARSSAQNGTRLYFDVVYPTPSSYELRTYVNQRGQDRTQTGGVRPVVLSEEAGTLRDPDLIEDWRDEVTFVYGGGKGEKENRLIVTAQDDTRINESIFGRREGFLDGKNYETTSALQAATDARLEEGRPRIKFTGEMVDTKGNRFGKDWDLGDRVTALFEDFQVDVEVASVRGHVDSSGKETITARLEHVD